MHYSRYIIFIAITVILIFLYNRRVNIVFETLTNMKRPTNTTPWPQNVVKQFLQFQHMHNPHVTFDMKIVQQQATVDEVKQLIKDGKWPWSQDVQNMYKDAVANNSIIRRSPATAEQVAQTIYNQTAIMELLSWNTKEGTFLLSGVTIGHSPDMPATTNNIVKCGQSNGGDIALEKIVYSGYDSINGRMLTQVTPVSNEEIPQVVNGFEFVDKPCNPCVALRNPNDYSCPFVLNTGNGYNISPIWAKLWGITSSSTESKPEETSDASLDKDNFPILNKLKDEITTADKLLKSIKTPTPKKIYVGNDQNSNVTPIGGDIFMGTTQMY